jgi:ABC-2 type transport system ATP-binding protein
LPTDSTSTKLLGSLFQETFASIEWQQLIAFFGDSLDRLGSQMLLDVQNLHYRYGERIAVHSVSFAVAPGEIFGLLGPNGAGKTTTLSMISGHLTPQAGTLLFENAPFLPAQNWSDRKKLGFVPQELALYESLTAKENLELFAQLSGTDHSQIKNAVSEQLRFAELESRAGDKVSSFSGGMKRRLNLVIGLLHSPQLVLMDEPTVGVDPQSRNHLFESIESLRKKGMSVLYTTHYMEEAERLCDRIAIMNEGNIVAIGTAAELRSSIGNPSASLEQVFLELTGRSLRDE